MQKNQNVKIIFKLFAYLLFWLEARWSFLLDCQVILTTTTKKRFKANTLFFCIESNYSSGTSLHSVAVDFTEEDLKVANVGSI